MHYRFAEMSKQLLSINEWQDLCCSSLQGLSFCYFSCHFNPSCAIPENSAHSHSDWFLYQISKTLSCLKLCPDSSQISVKIFFLASIPVIQPSFCTRPVWSASFYKEALGIEHMLRFYHSRWVWVVPDRRAAVLVNESLLHGCWRLETKAYASWDHIRRIFSTV